MSKYKITEIEHPKYPWLHRIQALINVNEKVPKGTLGGFVENENNLSQEGTCWIYDDAICCENGEERKKLHFMMAVWSEVMRLLPEMLLFMTEQLQRETVISVAVR